MYYMLEKIDHNGYRVGAIKQVDKDLVQRGVEDFVRDALCSDSCKRIAHAILYDHTGKMLAAENA